MKNRKNVLKDAGVLLIAAVMVLSTMIVTANTNVNECGCHPSDGIELTVGVCDNFALPTEPTYPSNTLLAFVAATYPNSDTRDCDEDIIDRFWVHTFDLEGVCEGDITAATLKITIKNLGDNDGFGFGCIDSVSDHFEVGKLLTAWGIPVGSAKTLEIDLDAEYPSVFNTMVSKGWLDVYVQDDSMVDCAVLTVWCSGLTFMGIPVAPLGNAKLEIGEHMRVYNLGSGGDDGVMVTFGEQNAYTPAFKNPFTTAGAKMTIKSNMMIGQNPLSTTMQLESQSGDSGGICIPDAISSPAIIVCPRGDGNGLAFYKEVEDVSEMGYFSGLTQGISVPIPDAISYPPQIYMNEEGAWAVKCQVMIGVEFSAPVQWTWEEQGVDQLSITKLMVICEKEVDLDPDDTVYISSNEFYFSGVEEVTMLEHYAYKIDPVVEPTITGPTSGKTGTEQVYTIANIGTQHAYIFIDFGDGSDIIVTPVMVPPGKQCMAAHTWSEKGTYTIKTRAMNTWGGMSDWATLTVSMPKNKATNTMPLFLRFLEQHPILHQLLQRFQQHQ